MKSNEAILQFNKELHEKLSLIDEALIEQTVTMATILQLLFDKKVFNEDEFHAKHEAADSAIQEEVLKLKSES